MMRFLVAAGIATGVALVVVLTPRLIVWLAEQPLWPLFAVVSNSVISFMLTPWLKHIGSLAKGS